MDNMKAKISVSLFKIGTGLTALFWLPGCGQEAQKAEAPAQKKPETVKEIVVDSQMHLVKPMPGEVISVKVFLKGGVANYSKENEGIEALALKAAVESGGENTTPNEWQQMLTEKGIDIKAKTNYDYSVLSVRATSDQWQEAWDKLTELMQRPGFAERVFTKTKEQFIANAVQRQNDPNAFLSYKAMQYAFQEGDYAKNPWGTPKALQNIDQRQVLRYYKDMVVENRLMIVGVGPLDSVDMARKIKRLMVRLPERPYKVPSDSALSVEESTIEYFDQDVTTNYVKGLVSAPPSGTRENLAMKLAFRILNENLAQNNRSEAGMVAKQEVKMKEIGKPFGILSFSSDDPTEDVKPLLKEIKRIKAQGFDSTTVAYAKNRFLTQYYLDQETVGSQAMTLGKAEIMDSWVDAELTEKRISNVTEEMVNRVFNRYIKGIQWYYLGDRSKVKEEVFLQEI